MSATIHVDDWTATVTNGEWSVVLDPDSPLPAAATEMLASSCFVFSRPDEVRPYDPNPDLTHASRVAEFLDGEVVRFDESPLADLVTGEQVEY